MNSPKVVKETKNSIKVDFNRTSKWTRFRLKYLTAKFLGQVVWIIFRTVILVGISYVILFPFIAKVASSFMGREDFVDVTVKLIPRYPTLDTYKAIIRDRFYFEAMRNSFILSMFCGVVQTIMCTIIGYGFAKFKFKGNKIVFMLVVFTMVIPHDTLQLSMFMKFRYFDIFWIFKVLGGGWKEWLNIIGFTSINLNNSYWPLAVLSFGGLAFKNGLYIFMMRQFFRGVPDELEESAYIDGSNVYRTFAQIIVPLSIPMMITIFLFAFSWQWTDGFYTEVFFTTESYKLIPNIIGVPKSLDTNYAGQNLYISAIQNTCGLMIIAPLIVIYLFFQRYLIQGIERSGIVG